LKRRRWAAAALLALLGAAVYLFAIRRAGFSPEARAVAALRQQLSQLQEQFEALAERAPDKALVSAPGDGLVIGIPTDVARDVAQQIVAGYLGRLRLTLRRLRVHKSDDLEARILFAKRTVGSYDLEAEILVAQATLRPRELHVSFEGQRLGFDVPVAIAEGRGRVRLRFVWKSKGLADIVCGDVDATRELDGRVPPSVHPLSGYFDIVAEGGSLVLRPSVARRSIHVQVEATDQAWKAFDELMAEQGGLCRGAVEQADVKQKLADLLTRGFEVQLPRSLLHDIQLPVSVQESLKLEDRSYTLEIKPARVVMTPPWIWYGTSVTIERAAP
jgi:hypothetical protein